MIRWSSRLNSIIMARFLLILTLSTIVMLVMYTKLKESNNERLIKDIHVNYNTSAKLINEGIDYVSHGDTNTEKTDLTNVKSRNIRSDIINGNDNMVGQRLGEIEISDDNLDAKNVTEKGQSKYGTGRYYAEFLDKSPDYNYNYYEGQDAGLNVSGPVDMGYTDREDSNADDYLTQESDAYNTVIETAEYVNMDNDYNWTSNDINQTETDFDNDKNLTILDVNRTDDNDYYRFISDMDNVNEMGADDDERTVTDLNEMGVYDGEGKVDDLNETDAEYHRQYLESEAKDQVTRLLHDIDDSLQNAQEGVYRAHTPQEDPSDYDNFEMLLRDVKEEVYLGKQRVKAQDQLTQLNQKRKELLWIGVDSQLADRLMGLEAILTELLSKLEPELRGIVVEQLLEDYQEQEQPHTGESGKWGVLDRAFRASTAEYADTDKPSPFRLEGSKTTNTYTDQFIQMSKRINLSDYQSDDRVSHTMSRFPNLKSMFYDGLSKRTNHLTRSENKIITDVDKSDNQTEVFTSQVASPQSDDVTSRPACPRDATKSATTHEMTALVSLPGAGTRWVRDVLEQLTGEESDSVYNIDAQLNTGATHGVYLAGRKVAIETHSTVTENFDRALIVISNPFSVEHSHRIFRPESIDWQRNFVWLQTYSSWLMSGLPLLVLTLEDIIDSPLSQIVQIANFLQPPPERVNFECPLQVAMAPPNLVHDLKDITGFYSHERRRINQNIDQLVQILKDDHPAVARRLESYKMFTTM